MIQSREDLRDYLSADRKALGRNRPKPSLFDDIWRFEIVLRKCEYYTNCDCGILACTELSVFRTYHNLPPFYVDAMEVLAETAVTRCGYQLRTI